MMSSPDSPVPDSAIHTGPRAGGWADLFSPQHLAAALILAGGVALYAINVYVTAALLPSAIGEIGGAEYYAWVATSFLMASVVASMLVTRTLARFGASRAYVIAFSIFAIGSIINTVSPSMEVLLLGRAIQGFGGGLLAGLGYAVIRTALPDRLWTRAAGLISAMWGVGSLAGPALGGAFSQLGSWRGAFALLVVIAVILGVLSRRALPGRGGAAGVLPAVPVPSLVLLTLVAATFSVAAILPRGLPTAGGVLAGIILLFAFIAVEKRGKSTVLPHSTYARRNRLKWVYITLAILSSGAMAEAFIPLFSQRLGGVSPLIAGFIGAALSAGWTTAQLFSVNIQRERSKKFAVLTGPAVLAAGLFAYALLQAPGAGTILIVAWIVVLFIGGCGIGFAFPHLSVAAMRSSTDEVEAGKAAAGVSTTQLIANSISSAVVGILVALGGPTDLGSAQMMGAGMAVIALIGVLTGALAFARGRERERG